jgi:hypothetical protein
MTKVHIDRYRCLGGITVSEVVKSPDVVTDAGVVLPLPLLEQLLLPRLVLRLHVPRYHAQVGSFEVSRGGERLHSVAEGVGHVVMLANWKVPHLFHEVWTPGCVSWQGH